MIIQNAENATIPTHMCLPELAAERGDLSCHGLTAVGELLQLPLQLPSLGIGARVLLLHLLQLPLQLLQTYHRLIQLVNEGKRVREEGSDGKEEVEKDRGEGERDRV